MTHRVFSRNASSSRAIPTSKLIEDIIEDPVEPIFMRNKSGMRATDKLSHKDSRTSEIVWKRARNNAITSAKNLSTLGVHKQIVNRILEPFSNIEVIVSSTEWDNFFNLRISSDAQQEICILATNIKEAMDSSFTEFLEEEEYHLPYITLSEKIQFRGREQDLIKASVARCARVSYLNHNNTEPDIDKDIRLHDFLYESKHLSPFEHIATPKIGKWSNFNGWKQYRQNLYLTKEDIQND